MPEREDLPGLRSRGSRAPHPHSPSKVGVTVPHHRPALVRSDPAGLLFPLMVDSAERERTLREDGCKSSKLSTST